MRFSVSGETVQLGSIDLRDGAARSWVESVVVNDIEGVPNLRTCSRNWSKGYLMMDFEIGSLYAEVRTTLVKLCLSHEDR